MIPTNLLMPNEKFCAHDYLKTSHCCAIAAQQRCSIEFDENLLVRDGIGKTAA
jgi:hypothetical protein